MNTEGLVLLLSNIDDPMKTVRCILFTSLFALLLTSCTKESFDEKIVGKWQIQGMYQPDARGQISWWNIPEQDRSVIEFYENGSFVENSPGSYSLNYCDGTYTLNTKDQIQINSTCNTVPFTLEVNLTKKELTIIHQVREGQVKEKFIRL